MNRSDIERATHRERLLHEWWGHQRRVCGEKDTSVSRDKVGMPDVRLARSDSRDGGKQGGARRHDTAARSSCNVGPQKAACGVVECTGKG